MSAEKKQTAVEWLLAKIEEKNGREFSSYYTEFVEQALAMEREQMESKETESEKKAKERKEYCNFVDTLFEHNFR